MKKFRAFSKVIKLLLIVVLALPLTGCWDLLEMEEQAYVAVIGIDKGEGNKLEVTLQISNPQGGGFSSVLGSSPKEPAGETITITVSDILSIRDTANASVTRRLTYSHARTLVVSEEFARSERFYSSLEGALRDRQVRRNTFLVVSREKASEFIRGNKSRLETRPHKFYEFIAERWKELAFVPLSNVHKYLQRSEGRSSLFLGIYGSTKKREAEEKGNEDEYYAGQIDKEGGNPTQLIGSAVFKDGKMIGTLTGEETRFAQILRPGFKMGSIFSTYPYPIKSDFRIASRIYKQQNTKVRIDIEKDVPEIDVTVPISVFIIAIHSGVDYVEDLDKQRLLEKSIEEGLNKKVKAVIEKTQREFGGEPFLWSEYVRSKFSTWEEYMDYNWMEKYPKAKVSVKYDVTIEGFGKQVKPPDMIK